MFISRIRWLRLCVAGLLAASLISFTWAKDELPKAVRHVLSSERQLSGTNWNRRQQLGEEVIKAKNSAEEVRWHAGYVRVNGKWLPFEEAITPEPMNGNRREYLDRRSRTEESSKSQMDLAAWCGTHQLSEQSHAHNYHAMMLSPPNIGVRDFYRRMRYVRAGTSWLSPYDANEAKLQTRRYGDQLEQWTPACQQLTEDLESGRLSGNVRRNRLIAFVADEKVPALEVVLGYHSETSALAAVEAIEQVPTYHATQALGRIAVFSPWLFARDRAIASLKSRKMDEYIPQWLNLARAPLQTEIQILSSGYDVAFFFKIAEERESEIIVAKANVVAPGALAPPGRGRDRVNRPYFGAHREAYFRQLTLRLKSIDEWMQTAAETSKEEIEVINERISHAMKETAGYSAGSSPNEWWSWWSEQSGLEPVSQKQVVIVSEETVSRTAPRCCCLVAGTPIWTEHGLVAIERIQAGDRVLSKNIETGELAYKVVLHTTAREPFRVTKLAVGDDTIQAAEGHHFWVSGRGWTKTRELAAEQPLHTPIGIVRVASTESAEPQPTYNLVVADFHTYFVGKSAILSHDVLPPKPTNKVVPGLNDD